ncbi:phage tail protein [Escherichia coli]|nr:phage tail protein [Escherichia coli]
MATKYYAVLTNVGAAKLANATALGVQVEITQMAVGDGNGALPTPNPAQTALVHELRRAPLNTLSIDPNNANQIIAEQVIPEDVGGWWIREIGLFDKDGDMIAVANCAETYKPQLQEGSGRVQVVRMILIVSSTAAVTLKIDPSVVLATRQYVDDQIIQVKAFVDQQLAAHIAAADPHKQYAPKASPALTGTPTAPTATAGNNSTQLANTAFVQAALVAVIGGAPARLDTLKEIATAINNDPNFSATINNALALKAPLASPAMTGTPTAPTAAQTVNNTQIATTEFVKSAIAALVASSPAALDTLNELAAALGNDPNFATTVTNALAGKQPLDSTLTDLSGKTVNGILQYLGLTDLGIGKNIASPNLNLLSDATSSGFYVYGGNTDPDFGFDYGMVLTLLYDSVSKQRVQIYLPLANTAGATPIIRGVTGNTTVWKYKLFSEKYKPTPADVGMASGAPAIGVPFFWPSTAMPNTVISEWSDMVFLKFNGASFSAAAYPKLAQVLPGLMLPEARGEFPRIWDDGRGVDSGRALLSTQVDAIRNITGEVGFIQYFGQTHRSGALYSGGSQNLTNLGPGGGAAAQSIFFDASKDTTVSIANENRPRNIAFNFLVRAK